MSKPDPFILAGDYEIPLGGSTTIQVPEKDRRVRVSAVAVEGKAVLRINGSDHVGQTVEKDISMYEGAWPWVLCQEIRLEQTGQDKAVIRLHVERVE